MSHRTILVVSALLLAAAVTVSTGRAAAEPPATEQDAKPQQPAQRADIYDASADARKVIDAAVARAAKDNKRVLVQWGANWCGWCHLLHELCAKDRDIARKLLYEYEVVLVDVGRFDRNMELAASLGVEFEGNGIPYLTILDGSGAALANVPTGPLEIEGQGAHDPQRVLAVLGAHQAPPLSAESVLAAARSRAATEGKRVFLHFGAPWCGWCHRLEDWLASEPVARVLAKDFVDVKIDTDRMIGGKEILAKMTGGASTDIPWFAVLEPDGAVVATSMVEGKNLGCPWSPEEIRSFRAILARVARRISPDEIEQMTSRLGEKK